MKKQDPITILGCAACVIWLGYLLYAGAKAPRQEMQPVAPAVSTPPMVVTESSSAGGQGAAPALVAELDVMPMSLEKEGEFSAAFLGNGGGLSEISLNQYTLQSDREEDKDKPVVMGNGATPFIRLSNENGVPFIQTSVPEQNANEIVIRSRSIDNFLEYEQSWKIAQDDDYETVYTLKVRNIGPGAVAVNRLKLDCGGLPAFLSRQKQSYLSGNSGCVAYGLVEKNKANILYEKQIKKINGDNEKRLTTANTPMKWLAVSSKYFLFALRKPMLEVSGTAGKQVIAANFSGLYADFANPVIGGEVKQFFHGQAMLPSFTLNAGETATFTTLAYAGPKNYVRLQQMGEGIDSIMGMNLFFFWNCDWMGWISRVLLACMVWFAGLFNYCNGAYGLGIILVTLCVKFIFMPLTYRSTMSMKKMSKVQPQVAELRERFKDNPQRMYYEQQKLFKENGVNQLDGCLPMLFQIPVFFAMFNTFRSAIEIRNSSFLWASDLSMPDDIFGLPIRPLALLTGLTMLLQQKMTPVADPKQAKMMSMMSLVFVVFFYNMPAALTLYMTVNQLSSIVQMLIFRRLSADKQTSDTITIK